MGGKVAKNSTEHLSFEQICPCVCSFCFSLSGSSPFSLGSNCFSRGLFSTLPLYLFSFSFFSGCSLPVPLSFCWSACHPSLDWYAVAFKTTATSPFGTILPLDVPFWYSINNQRFVRLEGLSLPRQQLEFKGCGYELYPGSNACGVGKARYRAPYQFEVRCGNNVIIHAYVRQLALNTSDAGFLFLRFGCMQLLFLD